MIFCGKLDEGTRKAALADAVARLEEAKALIPQTEARLGEANSRLDEAQINFNAASKAALAKLRQLFEPACIKPDCF